MNKDFTDDRVEKKEGGVSERIDALMTELEELRASIVLYEGRIREIERILERHKEV